MASFFYPLLKRQPAWLKALPVVWLLLPGQPAGAQILDTFEVGSGIPAANNNNPLIDYLNPIQATNFVNGEGSTFEFNYSGATLQGWLSSLYDNWQYTRNFTNYGEMDASTTGFRFETKIPVTGHIRAGSFYNSGPIYCGTSAGSSYQSTSGSVSSSSYSGIYVNATNISNYGTIAIGSDGLAKFMGETIDLAGSTVTMQSQSSGSVGTNSTASIPTITAAGQTDISTNVWVPSTELQPDSASAPLMVKNNSSSQLQMSLVNSVPYFDVQTDNTGTNVIVRMIFLEDYSSGVTTNVYFAASGGDGFAHIEWAGTSTDPSSGGISTHYLYLSDDYVQGSSSNILRYGNPGTGLPANFSLSTTTTPINYGTPAVSGFVTNLLSTDKLTNNIYSYFTARLEPTSVSLNDDVYGPIALTNLSGRVEVTASRGLNISGTAISGMNYLMLNSTNDFKYDGQAQIIAPYSDFYLGSSNGSITITNLIQSSIPKWSGSVEAWSSRWIVSVTNTVATNTVTTNYDFRVLLVSSQLSPTTASQVQDFMLYSSNNVTISDQLYITRNFFMNCTNLLLTYNGVGNGAGSYEGVLDLISSTNDWAASLPRLKCLTNNGTIYTYNLTTYGSAASPYISLVNNANGFIENYNGAKIYTRNFENYGYFYTYYQFALQSLTSTMSGGTIYDNYGNFSATADSMVIEGTTIYAGKSMTLTATNLLTDNASSGTGNFGGGGGNGSLGGGFDIGGLLYGSQWYIGDYYAGVTSATGLVLPIKPAAGDLLGTTINLTANSGIQIRNTWAAQDRGYSVAGFTNNVAIGMLVLNAQATNKTGFYFTGTGTSNAMYVDCIQLQNASSYTNHINQNLVGISFNTNLVIYYAEALDSDGKSVARAINGFNTNHFRWVPSYVGTFSSTNVVYPDGTTNVANSALASDGVIDSNGNGTPNGSDPTPFFLASQVNFTVGLTNLPPLSARVQWDTIPHATNTIYYRTNLASGVWLPFTNFTQYYYGANLPTPKNMTNGFTSPPTYPSPATSVWIFDVITNMPHYYRVEVQPNLTYPF